MQGQKFMFSEPFASQLTRALNGYTPNKAEPYIQKATATAKPSIKQMKLIRDLGSSVEPETMREASALINTLLKHKK